MPRPEFIAALHGAWYDFLTASPEGKTAARERYLELLRQAAARLGCSPKELVEVILREDFRVWYKQEGLPKPPPYSQEDNP